MIEPMVWKIEKERYLGNVILSIYISPNIWVDGSVWGYLQDNVWCIHLRGSRTHMGETAPVNIYTRGATQDEAVMKALNVAIGGKPE